MGFRIAARWFEHYRLDDDISQEPCADPFARCNMWHVRGRSRDLLIDTGLGVQELRPYVENVFGRKVTAVITHAHFDHCGGFHEFDDRWMHAAEALEMSTGLGWGALCRDQLSPSIVDAIEGTGYKLPEILLDAWPRETFDPRAYRVRPAAPTLQIDEGHVIDLGDRHLEVLHLPGHSSGSIGLWEASTATLFSGDTVYDGPLIDSLPGNRRSEYAKSMRRLLDLPVRVVHAGHEPSFDGLRLKTLVSDYFRHIRAVACRDDTAPSTPRR
jgi:glyoxylase-like metal-dependent hydrolase (beta-lactamase superfamily II)